jgi:hypothetical protein
LPISKLFWI